MGVKSAALSTPCLLVIIFAVMIAVGGAGVAAEATSPAMSTLAPNTTSSVTIQGNITLAKLGEACNTNLPAPFTLACETNLE